MGQKATPRAQQAAGELARLPAPLEMPFKGEQERAYRVCCAEEKGPGTKRAWRKGAVCMVHRRGHVCARLQVCAGPVAGPASQDFPGVRPAMS